MNDKIFIGNGKEKVFDDGGSVINATITLDEFKQYFKEYGFTTKQGKKMLKIIIGKRREPDQYGKTHWITLDQWKPDRVPASNLDQKPQEFEDSIPF